MPYNNIISRTDATALIPEDASREIIQHSVENSTVLRVSRRLADMPRRTRRMPVMDALPTAYFVGTLDTGLKQTTEVNWTNKYLYAEELAVIVPIPENVLDDVDYDIWTEVRPHLVEAFGKAIDEAILYGTGKPTDWPDAVLTACTNAAHTVTLGAGADLYDDIMGVNGVMSKVEEDGYTVNGFVAATTMRAKLRGVRTADGVPVFQQFPADGGMTYMLDGQPIIFPRNGAMNPASALLFAGDWNQLVYAFRSDINYRILTEGVITDNTGAIVYNLPQQDMVALRATLRLAWQVPNPPNRLNTNAATRYPFAALLP